MAQYECGVCSDLVPDEPGRYVVVAESAVCIDCVKGNLGNQFRDALQFEHKWPVMWGEAVVLNIDDFKDHLPNYLVSQYHIKEEEYRTPGPDRIYCSNKLDWCHDHTLSLEEHLANGKTREGMLADGTLEIRECKKFIGSKQTLTDDSGLVQCTCGAMIHIDCGEALDTPPSQHKCEKAAEADPFAGLTRGLHYQSCPNPQCWHTGGLLDGCNHMVCPRCNTQYCYLCGQAATNHSGHWHTAGGCPRFNRPDAGAVYDDELLPGDDDEEDSDDGLADDLLAGGDDTDEEDSDDGLTDDEASDDEASEDKITDEEMEEVRQDARDLQGWAAGELDVVDGLVGHANQLPAEEHLRRRNAVDWHGMAADGRAAALGLLALRHPVVHQAAPQAAPQEVQEEVQEEVVEGDEEGDEEHEEDRDVNIQRTAARLLTAIEELVDTEDGMQVESQEADEDNMDIDS